MGLKTWFDNEIVPCVRADGGWLEWPDAGDGVAEIIAKGECAHCAALDKCLRWAQMKAKRELGLDIHFSVKRDPFLWRK